MHNRDWYWRQIYRRREGKANELVKTFWTGGYGPVTASACLRVQTPFVKVLIRVIWPLLVTELISKAGEEACDKQRQNTQRQTASWRFMRLSQVK